MSPTTPDAGAAAAGLDLKDWLAVAGVGAGVVGWLGARWRAWRARRQAARELAAALEEFAEVAGNAAAFLVRHLFEPHDRLTPDEAIQAAAVYAHELELARARLRAARGEPERRAVPRTPDAEAIAAAVRRELRRTQPVTPLADEAQDVLVDADLEPEDR